MDLGLDGVPRQTYIILLSISKEGSMKRDQMSVLFQYNSTCQKCSTPFVTALCWKTSSNPTSSTFTRGGHHTLEEDTCMSNIEEYSRDTRKLNEECLREVWFRPYYSTTTSRKSPLHQITSNLYPTRMIVQSCARAMVSKTSQTRSMRTFSSSTTGLQSGNWNSLQKNHLQLYSPLKPRKSLPHLMSK